MTGSPSRPCAATGDVCPDLIDFIFRTSDPINPDDPAQVAAAEAREKIAETRAADFAAPNPDIAEALEFARWHAANTDRRHFHWSALAYDLRRRYGDDGRALLDAGLDGYPAPGRATYRDETWANALRHPDGEKPHSYHPEPRPHYCDESLVTRMRAWRKDQEIAKRVEGIKAAAIAQAQFAEDMKAGKIPGPVGYKEESGMPDASAAAPTFEHGATLDDFVAYMPAHTYIFKPTREMWPATSVNSRIPPIAIPGREKPIAANAWLDMNRPVEQMTWAPGKEMEIRDRLIADGGWIERPGCNVFNLYRPPVIGSAPGDASPWINHVRYIFGEEADHIISWLAHRVQRPHEKVNHALVLGGAQGIGKDTLLEPVKHAVGPWNFAEVSPQQMLGRFNGFLKSVVLRISEARDLGDTDRFAFYDHLKAYTAAPPDVLRVDEKHMREHAILNVCGIIITTNHKSDGIFLPADDRRHFVAWSIRSKDDFQPDYWNALYRWFGGGGTEIVVHYLATLDLSGFDPKAPPPKTPAFWEIVDASRTPEDAEMADALDRLNRPAAVTLDAIVVVAPISFKEWLTDRKNRRKIPHRLDECGYVPARNGDASDGLWKIAGRRQAVYVKRELAVRDQQAAASALTTPAQPRPMPPLPGQSDQ